MADSSSPPPERKPYQNWRSQQSSNWRMKDETPRPEQPARTQQRSFDQRRDTPASSTAEATPGTRLYVGNLLYSAKGEDVEQFFADNGFKVAQINMSTDPFTGRNPSYCFVDLESAEEAARAMGELSGQEVLGRPVKINPGMKKSFAAGTSSTPRREWGTSPRDGNGNGNGTPSRTTRGEYKPTSERYSRPDERHVYNGQAEQSTSKRLYVGGLPKIDGQASIDAEMYGIFEGFEVTAVSKQISPHPSKASEAGNHFYLFVDLVSTEEAGRAMDALDGKEMGWGGRLRVNRAKGENKKVVREPRVTLDDFSKLRVAEKDNVDLNGNGAEVQSR